MTPDSRSAADYTISQGYDEPEAVLRLLNDAFDGWGDDDFLRWKFDAAPRFDGDHVFTVERGENVVAARVLFSKELERNGGETFEFFVAGDTCVAEGDRGQGLYSDLLAETRSYRRELGVPISSSFNRKGVITYETKIDRGWHYRELPLHVRILRPEEVIPNYAGLALEGSPALNSVATSALRSLPAQIGLRLLPDLVAATAVEVASSDQLFGAFSRRVPPERHRVDLDEFTYETISLPPSDSQLDEVSGLYDDALENFTCHFSRDEEDLEHMLAHPMLAEAVLLRCEGEAVGFAPLAIAPGEDARQLNVLDCISVDEATYRALVTVIEDRAGEIGADLVAMLSEWEPGPRWSRVDRQVLMWDEEFQPLEDDLYLGLYDVV